MKRALLIGLDQYPDPRNNLNSCVADSLAMRDLLLNSYGFESDNIRILHNGAATLAAVRSGLDELLAGASPGDQLVYFESSHGYRYPEGDTMVEVLCLYDAFLTDTEFAGRTQAVPPGVLSVVLDACHSGGMNKVFFAPDGPAVARAKVWQPPVEEAIRQVQQLQQVTKFKFFGRAIATEPADIAKSFAVGEVAAKKFAQAPVAAKLLYAAPNGSARPMNRTRNVQAIWASKAFKSGDVELNGALFSACRADQTAAAGSPATNNLSAFTYALLDQLDATASLTELCNRTVERLEALNMAQTPVVNAPANQPNLLNETFITLQPTDGGAVPANGGGVPDVWGQVFGGQAAPPPLPQPALDAIWSQIFGKQQTSAPA